VCAHSPLHLLICPRVQTKPHLVAIGLQAINKPAEIIECTYGRVPIDQLLGIQAFSLDRVLAQEPDFLVSHVLHAELLCLWPARCWACRALGVRQIR
jgi:hypothetical protein